MTRVSLRARLLALMIALLAVGLGVGGFVAAGALEKYLVDRVDAQLRPLADLVALGLESDADTEARLPSSVAAGAAMDFLGNPYLADLAPDGTIDRELSLVRPGTVPRPEVPRLDHAAVAARAGQIFEVPSRNGDEVWRMIVLPRTTSSKGSVVVAASRADVDATITRLQTISLVTGAGLLVLLGVAGWFALRAGLRPLRRIEDTASGIARGDLSRRIPDLASPGTEVGRLSAALNGMLGQLETAFAARARSEARMRRFVADVSHELRTPLTGIKGFTELYLMGGLPERADVDRTMRRIDAEAGRLAGLTEDLLLLARIDNATAGGDPPLDLGPADLRTLAADAAHDLRVLAPDREVRLTGPDGGPVTAAPVNGDEDRPRQVVLNLVGNVIAHTPPGSGVRIGVGTVGRLRAGDDAGRGGTGVSTGSPGWTPHAAGKAAGVPGSG